MKAICRITTILALALSASTALAAPLLKADIVVEDAIVTVGDMFADAGAIADRPLFRAPAPGTTGTVPLDAIRAATARIGFSDYDLGGLTLVRVSRSASLVDETLISELVVADLRHRGIVGTGMAADVLLSTPIEPINTPVSVAPATLENLRYLPGNGTFSARFTIEGFAQPLDVSGSVALNIEAPHLAASLPAGTVLTEDHIVMRPVPVQQADAQGVATLDQLVGMSLNRQSREGLMLRPTDVSVPLAVAKNDLVTIFYRQGPMTLTVKGQAVSGAAEGAPLQVLNLVSRRIISAKAIAPGAVEVSSGPIAVAGL
jgi:flagella basal body P-ring formation protein FlgA